MRMNVVNKFYKINDTKYIISRKIIYHVENYMEENYNKIIIYLKVFCPKMFILELD